MSMLLKISARVMPIQCALHAPSEHGCLMQVSTVVRELSGHRIESAELAQALSRLGRVV